MTKNAVILFNLGGPDQLTSVKPFLFNLFNDPAIIRLPPPFRQALAWLISTRRDKTAREIYGKMGGRSPILPNTQAQAEKLEEALGPSFRCFIAMRYWHPFVEETLKAVKAYNPEKIILLPLYPQFSTTTTASSFKSFHQAAKDFGLTQPVHSVCCYPTEEGFIESITTLTKKAYERASQKGNPRILFSAHGLPEKIVKAGDPYQWQCEQTVESIVAQLAIPKLDYQLCFQSRVGPLAWIGPSTDSEIRRAGRDKVPLIVVPIAFVSEHSETLVEIDIEYRHLAEHEGVPFYVYVPTVSISPPFIDGLAHLTKLVAEKGQDCLSWRGDRQCPHRYCGCGYYGRDSGSPNS